MDINEHIPEDFPVNAKVWIYQSSRLLRMAEAFELEPILQEFVTGWKSHGAPVRGYANLFYGRFLIFMADEKSTGVSGCSTDSSVRIVKQIGEKLGVDFFDRLTLCFLREEKIEQVPLAQIDYAAKNRMITADTLFFDNTITTKEQLLNGWPAPIKDTWLAKRVTAAAAV